MKTIEKKPATEAWLKADKYRDSLNPGKTKIVAKDYSCTIYVYNDVLERPCATFYKGRARKANKRFYFKSEESRAKCVNEYIQACMESKKASKPTSKERGVIVGDVLRASWGYDQTNIDYYLVTKLIGKTMVEIVEIGQQREIDGHDTGKCVPDLNNIVGEPMRKRASEGWVRVDSVRYAKKKEVVNIIEGVKMYTPDTWSSYH